MSQHASGAAPHIFFDVTTMTHAGARAAGASRVESRFGRALRRAHPSTVVPVAWSSTAEQVVLAPEADLGDGTIEVPDDGTRRVLLVTGSGWLSNIACLHGLVRARHELGAELHVVIHDLVHALFPHWSPREDVARWNSHLEAMIAGADRLLVYSESTANDLARLVCERQLRVPDVQRIALGVEFADGTRPCEAPSPALETLAATPFALYVSTITFRKNHAFLCDVWARLAAEMGPALPRLVLAGHVAPDMELVMERLRRDPALRDHLVLVSGSTDADLAWLYSHCAFTLFPSLYEGWGLPVSESLAFGKVCLASSTSAVPEAASGVTPLIDPHDFRAWCGAVRAMADVDTRADAERCIRDDYRPTSWEDAADRLWNAVSRPLDARGRVATDRDKPADVSANEPWHDVRSRLGERAARRMRLALTIADVPAHGIRLQFTAASRAVDGTRVEIEVNGVVRDAFLLAGSASCLRRLEVPRDVLLRRALIDIVVVARSATGGEIVYEAPVTLRDFSVVPLTPSEEAAALDDRRVQWRLGDTCHFSAASSGLSLLHQGWGEAAHWGVWTVQPTARITFRPMPQPSEDLVLRVATRAFVWPSHPSMDVDVVAGGRVLTTWRFQHPTDAGIVERSVVIPRDVIESGIVDLQLSIPDCRSPRELAMSQDDRQLGLGFARACIVVESSPADPDWLRRRHSITQLF